MVLELIERVLAALIILGLLVIVLFLAFPDRNGKTKIAERNASEETLEKSAPAAKTERPASSKGDELKKADAQSFPKTEARLPNSRDNQDARYYVTQRRTPNPTPKRYAYKNHSSTPYVRQIQYADPWRQIDRYECSEEQCGCRDCDRPYWAPPSPDCWD